MNERIKELFKKAANKDFPNGVDKIHSNELERFAELIVNECAMIARKMEIRKAPYIGVTILEHFGVK